MIIIEILLYIIYIQQKNQQRLTIAQSIKNKSVRVETIQHSSSTSTFSLSSAMNDFRR